MWAVSLLWCPPIPLAVSSARKICCRSRALCTPARMSYRTRLRLSSRVLASVAALELACGESAGTTPNIAIPLLSHSCMTWAQVDQMNVPCVERATSSLSYLLKCPDASLMIATACLPAFVCRIAILMSSPLCCRASTLSIGTANSPILAQWSCRKEHHNVGGLVCHCFHTSA